MNTLVHFGLTTYSNGSCNGTAAVVISGGTSSFTYNWSNGMSIGAIDGLCAGEYCVSVSDANACSASNCVTIVNPAVLSVSISSTNVSCNGMCNGTIIVTPTGGTSPYTYSWANDGMSGNGGDSLCVGEYCVTVTDAHGCTASACVTITQPTVLTASAVGVNTTSCTAGVSSCDGTATSSVNGGTAPYSYMWSNGATTSSVSSLCAAIYGLTITDNAGCSTSTSVTISCPVVPTCEGFKTITQGGWGATPNGNNPGTYMTANFAAAFPNGLKVGGTTCTGSHWLKLTNAQAVTDFLPSGGTPNKLLQNLTNPGSALSNTLAGQVVAAALNIRFDNWDPNFGNNTIHSQDLYYANGTFAGWTVLQVFNEANKKLSGCTSQYSYSELTNALDWFNSNYDGGTADLGHLTCGYSARNEDETTELVLLNTSTTDAVTMGAYPNPFSTQTSLEFVSSKDLTGTLEVYNIVGVKISELFKGEIKEGVKYAFNFNSEDLPNGMYLARLTTNDGNVVQNIVKIRK